MPTSTTTLLIDNITEAETLADLHSSSSEELHELTALAPPPPAPGGATKRGPSNVAKLTSGSTLEEMIRLRHLKTSQNITESVPVPSSEHVAEIVGRQGCKIKALRAKTNTYIKTPIRGEQPQFVITGRREDVITAKREIQLAADHFSQIRARRGNGANTPTQGSCPQQQQQQQQQQQPPTADSPCHTRHATPTPPINTPHKSNSVSSSSASSISLSPPKLSCHATHAAYPISPPLTDRGT